jgi:hypothetical protein
MEFMGRKNLVLNINIGWIRNSGNTTIHGLTIYSLQMLYGSTPLQLVIFCEENPISTLGNLSIHMLLSFFVANSKAYEFFSPICCICIIIIKIIYNFFLINWFIFHACYMPHSMWNGYLWEYVHYEEKE